MAVRQEAPIHKGPGLSIPEVKIKKRKHKAGKIIGSAILAGSLGFVALGGYEIYSNNQKNNPEPTPIAGGIGEPSNSYIPTPFSTENPTFTPPPKGPSSAPEATPPAAEPTLKPTENLSALGKKLKSWVDGTYKMPELFKQGWDGKDAPLHITFLDLKQFENMNLNTNSVGYQGVLLGSVIVDQHLIMYVGQRDEKGNNYYFPVNVRILDTEIPVTVSEIGSFIDGNTSRNFIFADLAKAQENIQKNTGRAISFSLLLSIPPEVKDMYDFSDIEPSLPYAVDFTKYSMHIGNGAAYTKAPGASKFRSLINHEVTRVDPSKIPSLGVLSVRDLVK